MEALHGSDVELEALVVIGSQAHVVVVTIGYVWGGTLHVMLGRRKLVRWVRVGQVVSC